MVKSTLNSSRIQHLLNLWLLIS